MRKQVLAFLTLACLTVFFAGCAKEKSFETGFGPSAGSLQSETTGDCLPKNVAGIYEATVALTADNYIEVDVDVTTAGSYTIRTDTVNGFSYKAQGYFTATGKQTVKLTGSGTPTNSGISNFTVSYAGTTCVVAVSILPKGASGPAVFELLGSPNSCLDAIVDGVYGEGIAVNNSHTVTLKVNVTTIGVYNITTTTTNGITFKGSGPLIDLGPTTITLKASGTPGSAGLFSIPIAGPNSCTFDVTVVGPATYTMDCSSIVVNGTYAANTNLGATNTIKLTVDVTSVGPYSITTTAVDGMIFTGSGNFGATGLTDVTLNGTGKPGSAGNKTITINGVNGQTCTGDIVVGSAPDPNAAIFTIEGTGSPLLCSGATPTGEYLIGVALNPSVNKVTVKANVTKAGTANITTATVNGIKFSINGSFPTTGNYNVELVASGTPTGSPGVVNFTLPFSGSSCGFSVTTKAPAQYTINCPSVVVNGTYTGGVALTAANTITVEVNVTSVGPYSIATTSTNGIMFVKTGDFTTTGTQTITLNGSGTPTNGGTILHGFPTTPICTFNITVAPPAVQPGFIKCKINGVSKSFETTATATKESGGIKISLAAEAAFPSKERFSMSIEKMPGNVVGTGTYTVNGHLTGGNLSIFHLLNATYKVDSPSLSDLYSASTSATSVTPQNPAFTIVITSMTSTRVQGTFTGPMKHLTDGSTRTITEGTFDLPIQ